MTRLRRTLVGLVVFGTALAIGSQLSFPAFSASTANTGNAVAAGTVALRDDDKGAVTLSLANAREGATTSACVRVTYDGTLPASVDISAERTGTLARFVELRLERGTSTSGAPSCAGFVLDTANHRNLGAGVLYSGALSAFPSAAEAIADPRASWARGDTAAYRLTATLSSDSAAQGLTSGVTFSWRARNR